MTLKDCYGYFDSFTGLTSTNARTMCVTGIATIWFFKTNDNKVPQELHWPAIFFLAYFFLDTLQYVFASGFWAVFISQKEKALATANNGVVDENEQFDSPDYWYYHIANCLFWSKLIVAACGFFGLIKYIFDKQG